MSRTIDERVVELRFDNQQFEQNARTSIGTLEKLKQLLNFGKPEQALDNMSNSVRKFDMGPIGNAVDTIHSKFSALEVIGITALANIANQAINTGKQMVNSLTVAPISDGFHEYELKMGSIQTIMMSTGESLDTVNKYLDDLNTYADRTIYSFKDMTSNIGKFTNAGVGLNDAVKAIQGVSNVAAISGANTWDASRAMYNFAQALSSGAVKLIDWKSIENANMATVEFKQTLIDTALALGTVEKTEDGYVSTTTDMAGKVSEAFTETKGFNDSLSHQWMTTKVLTTALQAYSHDVREMTDDERKAYHEQLIAIGYTEEQAERIEKLGSKAFDAAQEIKTFSQMMDTLKEAVGSGWARSFEIIFGDFEKAKKLWTNIGNFIGGIIDEQAEQRNAVLQAWADRWSVEDGGRGKLLRAFGRIGARTAEYIQPIKDAFNDLIPKADVGWLGNLIWQFAELTKHMKWNKETYENLGLVARGFFSTLKLIGTTALSVGKYGIPVVKEALDVLFRRLLEFAGPIASQLSDSIEGLLKEGSIDEFLKNTSEKLLDFIAKVDEAIGVLKEGGLPGLIEWLKLQFKDFKLETLLTDVKKSLESFVDWVGRLFGRKNLYASIQNLGTKGVSYLTKFRLKVDEAVGAFKAGGLKGLGEWLTEQFSKIDFKGTLTSFHDKFKSFVNKIGEFFGQENLYDKISKPITDWITNVKNKVTKTLDDLGISKGFAALREKLSNFVNSVANFFGIDLEKLGGFKFDGLEKLTNFISTIKSLFKSTSDVSSGEVASQTSTIQNATSWFSAISDFFENNKIIAGIREFVESNPLFEKFSEAIATMRTSFDDLSKMVSDFKTDAEGNLTSFADAFGNFIEYIKPKLDSVDWVAVAAFAGQITSMVLAFKAISTFALAVKAANGVVETATNTMTAVKGFFGRVNGVLDNFTVAKTWTAKFKSVAKSLVMISAAVWIITDAISTMGAMGEKEFKQGMIGFIAILGALAIVQILIAKLGKGSEIGAALTILAFAAAVELIVKALDDLINQIWTAGDPHEIEAAFNNLALIMIGLLGCVAALALINKKIGPLGSAASAIQIVGFAIALKVVVWTLQDLIKLQIDDIYDFLGKLGAVLFAMVVLAGISSIVSKGAGFGILGIALALKVLVSTFDEILAIDMKKVRENISNFMLVFGLLAVLMALTSVLGNNALKGGIGILAIAIALGLMAGVITQLGNMKPKTAMKGLIAIIGLMAGMTMLAMVTATAGQYAIRAGIAMIFIAIALGLMAGVVLLLGSMKPSMALKGVLALLPLMAAIGILMLATHFAGEHALTAAISIGIITLAIGGLVYTIYILAQINSTDLAKAIAAIGSLMILMSIMMVFSKFTGMSSMAGILAMSGALVLLCGALVAMSYIPSEQLDGVLNVMKQVAAIMAALMFVSQFTDHASVAKILVITACVALLTGLLTWFGRELKDVNGDNMAKQLEGISVAVAAIGGVLALLSVLDVGPMDAAKAGAAFDIFVALLAGLALAIDKIDQYLAGGELVQKLEKSVEVTEKCGKLIGSFIHGIVDGFKNGSADTSAIDEAPTFAEKVTSLVDSLVAAADKISGKEGALESLKGIGDVVMSFAKADLMEGIAMFIGSKSDFAQFAGTLDALADGLSSFAEKVEGGNFTDEAIEGSIKMAGLLATLYGTDDLRSGGFLGKVLGDSIGLDTFGDQLEMLADGLSTYAEKVAGGNFTDEAIDGSIKLAQLLATLYGSEDLKSGGFIGKVLGESIGLDFFGDQLVTLAQGLAGYAEEINKANFNPEQIEKSKHLAKMLVALSGSEQLVRGGLIGAIAGGVIPLDTFGTQIKKLASGLKGYVDEINDATFDQEQIDKSKQLAEMLATLANNEIPTSGGIAGIIFGDKSLSNFGNQLKALAKGVVDYVKEISDANIDMTTINKSKQLAYMVETIAKVTNVDAQMNADLYGRRLEAFGKSLVTFINDISGLDADTGMSVVMRLMQDIPALADAYSEAMVSISDATADVNIDLTGPIEDVKNGLAEMKEAVTTSFGDAWTAAAESVSTASETINAEVVTMMSTISETLVGNASLIAWKNAGRDLTASLAKGIKTQAAVSAVKRNAKNVSKDGYMAAKDTKSKWEEVGKDLAKGLANGVAKNSSKIKDAARQAARDAYNAAKNELKSKSPSKKFMQLGKWADEGLAIGIEKNSHLAIRNVKSMARELVTSSKDAIDRVCELMNSDMIDDPVIKPVLDLSEFQNGSNRLYSMMSDMDKYTLRGNVELATDTALSVNRERQTRKDRDNDVLSALIDGLKELKKQNDSPRGNTYIIDGITYDDGSNVSSAVGALIRAAKIGGRA